MSILRAILAGERDCLKLAQLRHPQIKSSALDIAKALEGDYCQEHLFALQTAPDLNRMRSAEKRQEALRRHHLEQLTGADLTKLPVLDLLAVERILSEIGLDMSRWPSEKHFCAWLNVAPNNRISGGPNPFQ
jgi:transposase